MDLTSGLLTTQWLTLPDLSDKTTFSKTPPDLNNYFFKILFARSRLHPAEELSGWLEIPAYVVLVLPQRSIVLQE